MESEISRQERIALLRETAKRAQAVLGRVSARAEALERRVQIIRSSPRDLPAAPPMVPTNQGAPLAPRARSVGPLARYALLVLGGIVLAARGPIPSWDPAVSSPASSPPKRPDATVAPPAPGVEDPGAQRALELVYSWVPPGRHDTVLDLWGASSPVGGQPFCERLDQSLYLVTLASTAGEFLEFEADVDLRQVRWRGSSSLGRGGAAR